MLRQRLTRPAELTFTGAEGGKDSHERGVLTGTAGTASTAGTAHQPSDPDHPPAALEGAATQAATGVLQAAAPSEPWASEADRVDTFEADGWWAAPVPTFTYLAGAAGSGKTFLAKQRAEQDLGIVIAATTGIAAVNCNTITINALLNYFDTSSLQEAYVSGFLTARLGKLWKAGVRRIVIDEVSMLPAEQLMFLVKAIEEVNERGYVLSSSRDDDESGPPQLGLTVVGDFCQLSPVKAAFAFEADEWASFAPHIQTLTRIHRQADPDFITMLRAARRGDGQTVVDYFQSRNAIQQETDDHFDGPTILAKNEPVDRYNQLRLSRLAGRPITFTATRWGKARSEWSQIPETLALKAGALVMILANRRTPGTFDGSIGRQLLYANGDLAELVDVGREAVWNPETEAFDRNETVAYVKLQRTGEVVTVVPVERETKVPCDSARRKELIAKGEGSRVDGRWEILGAIRFMPLRLAWASTVHRSQGLTLDAVQINCRDHFFTQGGMLYVALSRARTAEGLRLIGSPKTLIDRCRVDSRVKQWI